MTDPQGVPTGHPPQAAARPLGLWMATALVVGSMIGSGVFLLPAALAPTAPPAWSAGPSPCAAPCCWP